MTAVKYPEHTPLAGGGCLYLRACECERVVGRHCGSCGRLIATEQGRVRGNSHTFHIGSRERLWALEAERRKAGAR